MSERSQETRVRRKRRFSLLCLVVIGSILLSGCGGANDEKAAQQDSGGDQGSETKSTIPATAPNTAPATTPATSAAPSRAPSAAQEAPAKETAPDTATAPGAVQGNLDGLRVAPAGSMSGYSRESFKHWSKASSFGWDPPQLSCDVREAALIRDGKDVEVGEGCKVISGEWFDPYTAQTFTDPSDLDTDHVVPLANAFRSGASEWSDDERERYANDPLVLLSVEDNANQQKGDKGPEAWKPPNRAEWCDYATRWIAIKGKYDLTVNPDEKAALEEMLRACA